MGASLCQATRDLKAYTASPSSDRGDFAGQVKGLDDMLIRGLGEDHVASRTPICYYAEKICKASMIKKKDVIRERQA
jgi:hypothetical protein